MKKYIILLLLLPLLYGCDFKRKFQLLPEAKLNQPYFVQIDFGNGNRTYPERFHVAISPENSGLSVSGVTGPYDNETIISGTPKVKQDISIEIFYVIRGPVGFFEDYERENHYLIKVKE